MKNSVRRLLCAALALLLIFGAVEVPYLPADEQAADESLLAILGLADPDAAGHAAYAEEVPPEPDSGDPASTNEASPDAEAVDESADETTAPETTGDPESTATPNPTDGAPSDPDESDVPGDPQNSASPDDTTDEEITENDAQLTQGYARIASGSSVRVASESSASELAVLDAGAVYVAEINETDSSAKICFAHEKLAYAAWADAADLTPLTAEELDALRIPPDAPTYGGHALPEPGARFILQLSIEACPELSPGDQVKLTAAHSDGKLYPIEWSSSDPSVAEISADGTLTAVSPGTATITASGVCMPASIQIAVSEPESISLSASTLTIGAGESVTDGLVCTVTPERLSGELRWSSSNTRYVKVDKASGAITGVRTGSATVTVSTPSGLSASCKVTVRSAPRSVKLSAGATTLGVGDRAALSASFNSGAHSHGIRYAVSDESVLRVEDGRVYAIAPGTATVTAKTFNNKTASLKVTVVPAPESVVFSSDAAILGVGQTHTLSAAVNPESASTISYSGSDDVIATVSERGEVVALMEGTITVTATAYNGVSGTQTLTVVAEPGRIDLSTASATLCVGEKMDAPVVATPDNGMTGGLSFKSSNTRYATVSPTGRVSALRAGSVTITVTAYNGVTAKYSLKIVKAPTKLTLSGVKLLGVGDRAALKVTANSGAGVGQYSLSSSDPGVLEIDPATNQIVGVAPGTATVTVKNFNNKTASLKITVVPEPESVAFSSDAPVLGVGQTHTLSAAVNPESASAISYSGSDDAIATVSVSGEVVALHEGTITVTATAYNGASASQTLTVVAEPGRIDLSASSATLCVGEKMDAPVVANPDNGMTGGLSFKSSNTRYATVSPTGRVSALRAGSVTITVTAYNGVTAKYSLKIVKAPTKLTLSGVKLLGVGDRAALKVTANSGAGVGHYSLSSSDPGVLEIDPATNQIVGVAPGTATVTVRNFNNKTASLKLTVVPAPESVVFSSDAAILGVGQTHVLSAAVNSESASAISYSGSDDAIATVSERGEVTALREGSVTVTATAYNGVSASQTLTVVAEPGRIDLSASSATLCVGEKMDAPVVANPDNGMTGGLSFKSSNTRYATVSPTGRVSALRAGSVTITVTAYNGVTAKYSLKIVKAPTKLTLSGVKLLGVGDRAALKVTANSGAGVGHYSLSSSDPGVLEIDPETRQIVGVAPGTATVTVKNFNNKTASLKITVVPEPESVTFSSDAPVLGVGQSYALSAAVNSESASAISYSGSDDAIATVSVSGEVTALQKGTITVTATAYNGVSASQTLSVVPAPTKMEILENPIYLGVGEALTDALQLRFDEGSAASLSYKSSNTRYVKVDASGKLTGVRVGSATITVTTHNGVTETCKVIVQKAPSKVTLRLPMSAFSVGQIQTAEVNVTGRGHYSLSSSDPDVVAVEEGNILRALREGQVTITAKTYNGKTASAKLRVCPAPTQAHPVTERASVGEGMQLQAEFVVNEGSYATFRYEVADPELAQVDESGCVTGLKRGHTQIIATTHNGVSATMELEILPGPDSIRFDESALTLGLGETRALSFAVEPENAVGAYTYASSDPRVVSVSDSGMLAGLACGTAQITVTAQNGTSAALEVTVVPYSETHTAFCMAHRGASGYCPDNSIAAFKYAAVLGADMVELDVRKTKDGVLVVHHDATLSYKGKKYSIANLSMAAIRIANPDVCTLDEALECIAQTGMEVMIEFKITGIEAEVLDCVHNYGLQSRANYGSFTLSVIDKIKALEPSAKTVYIMNKADVLNKVVKNPEKYSADFISVSSAILTPAAIYRLHLGGKQVVAWTINTRSEIERFVAMGVDGITTNFPDYM